MSDVVALAAPKIGIKLAALLQPHKVALLAIEHQSAELMKEKVSAAPDTTKLKVARIILKASSTVSSKLAFNHASKEFKLLGIEPLPSKMPKVDFSYNDKLLGDLKKSLQDKDLTNDVKAYRASLAALAAANRSYTDMQLAMYHLIPDNYEIQKVWVANFNAGSQPCIGCTKLHNTSIPIDQEFKVPNGYKAYSDLQGPGLHIGCRCRLSVRVVKKDKVPS